MGGGQREYVEIPITGYIDTGISAPQGFKVDAMIQASYTTESNRFFGAMESSSPYLRNWIGANSGVWAITSSKKMITGPSINTDKIHIVADNRTPDNPTFVIDNVSYSTVASTFNDTSMSAKNLWLGRMNNSGDSFPCKIYSCKIYDATDTLVRDYVGFVDNRGIACFKDLVTNTIFYNQGTGDFTPGPEI